MMHKLIRYAALAGALGLGACELEVRNPNQPETERVLATPREAESLLGSYYRRWHAGMYGSLSNVWGMSAVMSFEDYSSLANNCMNARAGIPRPTNDNNISNACSSEQHRVYFYMSEVSRVASNIYDRFSDPDYSLGQPGLPSTTRSNERALAFAQFLRGVSNGYLAMIYDSASVVAPGQDALDPGPMADYVEVMDSALAQLDEAIVHAQAAEAAGGISIPQEWIPTSGTLTMPSFIQLINSYKARFRAGVARNPAERADVSAGGLVDWDQVIAEAQAGITADHDNITNTTSGPFKTWVAQFHTWGLWHQMPPWIIGMADTSGSYAAWIDLPLDQRGTGGSFLMATPDVRFPQGNGRTAQQGDFAVSSCEAASTRCERYFRNRPTGNDQGAGLTWGQSNYDFVKHHSWRISGDGTGQNGRIVFFPRVEVAMLEAEGHIRNGNYGAAAALINVSRTTGMVCAANCTDTDLTNDVMVAGGGGLPAVLGTVDGGLTGNVCVPKRPVNATAAGGGTVTCGNLMEAMKYEKRIETLQAHFASWFIDMRGWGDLPEGTPTHWAPPYQELQARKHGVYSIGTGTPAGGAAGPSTYGW